MARCAVRAGLRRNQISLAPGHAPVPSPDASLGDGDAAARRPYQSYYLSKA